MAGTGTLAVTPGSGSTINTLPPSGQDAPANSLPVVLDTTVETAPGTFGTKALSIQGPDLGLKGDAAPANPAAAGSVIAKLSGIWNALLGLPTSLGQKLMASSMSVALASDQPAIPTAPGPGENHLGSISGEGSHPLVTPVATALTYATGKCIGGLNDLTGFLRVAGKSALIQSGTMRAKGAVTAQIDLVVFRDVPSVTTGLVDGATFAVDAADVAKVSRIVSFAAWTSLGTPSLAVVDNIGKYMSLAAGTTGKCILVARGAVTLATAADLTVSLGLVQD